MPTPGVGRRTLLTIYDLLHLFTLNGSRIGRATVLDYLGRAMGSTTARTESRLRAFERLKVHMAHLEIPFSSETNEDRSGDGSTTLLVIPRAREAKRRIQRLLDESMPARAQPKSA